MSRRGQRARTPENFPRMKYRARKRHARNTFEPLLFDFMRSYPDFAASLGTSLGVFVEQLQKLAANVRTIRAQAVADYSASLEQMRRPWFASLADAEARGAKGSAEVGFAQCRCEDCEQRDAELLRRKPLDEVVADG